MQAFSIGKNALFNILRGAAGAAAAIGLPFIAARNLDADAFTTWMLATQIASLILYFEVGVPSAVARFVAQAKHAGDEVDSLSWAYSGASALAILGSIGGVIIVASAMQLRYFFPNLPTNAETSTMLTVTIIGLGAAVALPFSAFGGVFIGLSRSDITALITVTGKLLGVVAAGACAFFFKETIAMAIALAFVGVLSGIAHWVWVCKFIVHTKGLSHHFSVAKIYEISRFCAPFIVWSAATWITLGLGSLLVARFDYSALSAFAAVTTLTAFLTGIAQAIFSALMPYAAKLDAREERLELGSLLIRSTRITVYCLVICGALLIVLGEQILRLWLGSSIIAHVGSAILVPVVIGQCLRLALQPYATLVIATGEQSKIWTTPVAEAAFTIALSTVLGWKFGAIGVAVGGALSAFLTVYIHIQFNFPKLSRIHVNRKLFTVQGMIFPILKTSPVIGSATLCLFLDGFKWQVIVGFLILTSIVIANIWRELRD